MQVSKQFVLPEPLATLIPDTRGVIADEDALSLLSEVTGQLTSHLDQLIAQYDRLAALRDLSFQVAYGLVEATPALVDRGDNPVHRPDRFGLPSTSVGIAARFALERAVVVGQFGSKEPSEADICMLVRTSATHMEVDVLRELTGLRTDSGMPGMGRVSARKSGSALVVTYEPQQFDFLGYQQMRDGRTLDTDPADTALIEAMKTGVPDELAGLSAGMIEDLGFGVGDLFDTLVSAIQFNLEKDAQFLALEVAPFRSYCATQSAGRLAAFEYLTFSAEYLDINDLRPSATRHQKRRIVTHPFIVHEDLLVLDRDILFEALNRWLRYLLNGDWPAPARAREDWPTLGAAITARRNARGIRSFEKFVEAELDRIGLPWGSTSGANRKIGRARITGEIDALVVDAKRGVLWVIEAKDITSDQNLRSLQTELLKMTTKYLPQVSRAVVDVESDPAAVAAHAVRGWARRGTINTDRLISTQKDVDSVTDWEVRPLIVVRDRSAAEYLIGRTWAIAPVSRLRATLVGE